jgi:hypothetical protein
MEEYKFNNSDLNFNELFNKYKTLDTTYSEENVDFSINLYENCNLLQNLTTTFTVPSTNIRLRSFKNNYIIADTQTLDLDQTFYENNTRLFTTVTQDSITYINNINLTNIIKTHFNYTSDDIYPSKKIIITINLHREIVSTNSSEGALLIDMKDIKDHFHPLFDTLELDINQYVTGKHGVLEDTYLAPSPTNGGSGQNADLNSAGPAIYIKNNDPYYFDLYISTDDKVSGGFGASGGDGGVGKKNGTEYVRISSTTTEPQFSTSDGDLKYIQAIRDRNDTNWYQTNYYYWETSIYNTYRFYTGIFYDPNSGRHFHSPPTLRNPDVIETYSFSYDPATNIDTKIIREYKAGSLSTEYTGAEPTSEGSYTYDTRWYIELTESTYTSKREIAPTYGSTGSTANYSNNADEPFLSSDGDPGPVNDYIGGAGGTKGESGDITNIIVDEAANANIHLITIEDS